MLLTIEVKTVCSDICVNDAVEISRTIKMTCGEEAIERFSNGETVTHESKSPNDKGRAVTTYKIIKREW